MRVHERQSRWSAPLGAGLAFAGLIMLVLAIAVWMNRSPGWAYDFHAYFEAARRFIASGSPYQEITLSGPFRPGPFGLYLYSPLLAIAFVPLTALTTQAAIMLWLLLRIAALALMCALMPISTALRLAVFGIAAVTAPVLFDLDLGNISLLITFLAVVAWRWLDRPLGSVAIALSMTMRPTMALVCGWWLVRGRWRPLAWAVSAFVLIVLASLPFTGLQPWFEYVTVLRNVSEVTGVRANVDLGSAVLLFGGPAWAAPLALFAGYVVAALAVLVSLRRDRELSFVVTLMATLLLAPLLWDHYLTHLVIVGAFLASRGRRWGLLVPLLAWIPTLTVVLFPAAKGPAEGMLAFVALAGLLLPLTARDRGEPAGFVTQRLGRWRSMRPAQA